MDWLCRDGASLARSQSRARCHPLDCTFHPCPMTRAAAESRGDLTRCCHNHAPPARAARAAMLSGHFFSALSFAARGTHTLLSCGSTPRAWYASSSLPLWHFFPGVELWPRGVFKGGGAPSAPSCCALLLCPPAGESGRSHSLSVRAANTLLPCGPCAGGFVCDWPCGVCMILGESSSGVGVRHLSLRRCPQYHPPPSVWR